MEAIKYPDGELVKYGYDYGGNVVSVTGEKGGRTFSYVEDIGYDEQGRRIYLKLGNGVETRYEYDAARQWLKGIKTETAGSLMIQNIKYRFDPVGNVLGYENEGDSYATRQDYEYDGLYQLTGVTDESVSRGKGQAEREYLYRQKYYFDEGAAAGRRLGRMTRKTSESENSSGKTPGDNLDYQIEYEYDAGYAYRAKRIGNRYYKYDMNGNVVGEQDGPYEEGGTLSGGASTLDLGGLKGPLEKPEGRPVVPGGSTSGTSGTG